MDDMYSSSLHTEKLLASPFEWCSITAGSVVLIDATADGGTRGGVFAVRDFAIAKYLITNAQFERFVVDPNGYPNQGWWEYSAQARQWRQMRTNAQGTAFAGPNVAPHARQLV